LFAPPAADWIWKAYQVSLGESYTGDIVFFKKQIDIPEDAFNIQADLFIVTADNAYYFYVNDDWSGDPAGKAGFVGAYGPTNFYYISDGVNNLGGGTNSVSYETVGNVYPKDATIDTSMAAWSTIELWGISSYLHTGDNWLQIVAINEHAPPSGVTSNPAGLIYKVVVTYDRPADLSITKSGPEYAHVGDEITYEFTVTNNGPDEAKNVVVTDTLLGDIYGPVDLAAGASETFTVKHTVLVTDPDPLENTATVSSDTPDPDSTNNEASWSVDILHPDIEVTKTADPTEAHAGETITYTYTVTNPGDCPLKDVSVEDDVAGTADYESGDTNEDGLLDTDETWTFTATYTVEVGDPDPLENTATASGKDALDMTVTDTDTAEVDLIAKICGYKFYDANTNGEWDDGEPIVVGFKIELYDNGLVDTAYTDDEGMYCFDGLDAGTYTVKEVLPCKWVNTTPDSIEVTVDSGEISEDHNFGDVCLGYGGGKMLGFWSNKIGQSILTANWDTVILPSDVLSDPILASLPNTPITDASGIKAFLLGATAEDMRYMLAAQWLTMKLNVLLGYVDGDSLVYVGDLNENGIADPEEFMTVDEILTMVSSDWSSWDRAEQEYWKNVLDWANNNKNFLCPEPCYPLVYP